MVGTKAGYQKMRKAFNYQQVLAFFVKEAAPNPITSEWIWKNPIKIDPKAELLIRFICECWKRTPEELAEDIREWVPKPVDKSADKDKKPDHLSVAR